MTVYIDNMNAKYGRMIMCHMIADTSEELKRMAHLINLNVKWIQYPDTYKEHFDISLGYKQKALAHGAIEISMRELGAMIRNRRKNLSIIA